MKVSCFTCRYLASHGYRWICRSKSYRDLDTGDLVIKYLGIPTDDIQCDNYKRRPQDWPLPGTLDSEAMPRDQKPEIVPVENMSEKTRRVLDSAATTTKDGYFGSPLQHAVQYWLSVAFFGVGTAFFVFKLLVEPFIK